VALIGLALIAAGGIRLFIDRQTRAAEENIDPAQFDFAVTLTPAPSAESRRRAIAQPTRPAATANVAQAGAPVTPTAMPRDNAPLAAPPTAAPMAASVTIENPARLVIPAIDLDAPITEVHLLYKDGDPAASWQVPRGRMAGWQNDSARLGMVGNLVLNGHHNIEGRVFERLKDLAAGDLIFVYGPTERVIYALTERHLLLERGQPLSVRLAHAQYIQPTPDQRLTLVTCWPPTNYSHRLVLIALPISDQTMNEYDLSNRSVR
jgi:sortase A